MARVFFLFLSIALIAECCKPNHDKTPSSNHSESTEHKIHAGFKSPQRNQTFRLQDTIQIMIDISGVQPDSFRFFVNRKLISTITQPNWTWVSNEAVTGENLLRVEIYVGNKPYYLSEPINFLARNKPVNYSYKVTNTYPHDPKAYTQGLFYYNGYLYESTGQYGESSLRKIDIKTGAVLKIFNLPDTDFGEGIERIGNKIYMLTWEQYKGYVFNLDDFSLLHEFPITSQGWGLTFDGTYLIRSDGTHRLYFISPETLTEVKILEVFDNEKAVKRINEMEFIDGMIYANIYGEDYIVIINPKNGAVTGKINLSGLLSESVIKNHRVDVLNGIAWDAKNRRLFVTGKLWPLLFEIQITPSH